MWEQCDVCQSVCCRRNENVVDGMVDKDSQWPGWWDRLHYNLHEVGAQGYKVCIYPLIPMSGLTGVKQFVCQAGYSVHLTVLVDRWQDSSATQCHLRFDVTVQNLAVVNVFHGETHLYEPVQDLQQHTSVRTSPRSTTTHICTNQSKIYHNTHLYEPVQDLP